MESIFKDIRFVGLDLDDTLYDRNRVYEKVFLIMESIVKSNVSFSRFNNIYQQYSIAEFNNYVKGKKDKHSYQVDRVIRSYNEFGKNIEENQAIIFNALYEYYRNNIELRPNAQEFINKLIGLGYEPFILTNGPSSGQWDKIRALGLDKLITKNYIFVSDDLGVSKPDKKIFEYVQEKLGASANEIIYIGDHLDNDILGAIENQWNAIYFDDSKSIHENDHYFVVNDFSDLIKLFQDN